MNVLVTMSNFSSSQSDVEIFFTEDDFRANENPNSNPDGTGNMPVRVIKSSRIANPIVLDVVPLTVEMANTTLLAADIPALNPLAPLYAGNIILFLNAFFCFDFLFFSRN